MTETQQKKKMTPEAKNFYRDVLAHLTQTDIPFLIGGTFAINAYTGLNRDTKDIDIFCKAGDYPRILKALEEKGFTSEIRDERWLAKAHSGEHFADVIFGGYNTMTAVDDSWFENAPTTTILGSKVKLIPPVELIWSKIFRQERANYDGADINHMFLVKGKELDWKRLLMRMEQHWEVLFAHILNFRFVYPSERDTVPRWLIEECISRLQHQLNLPSPKTKVCRGYLFSPFQYQVDYEKWGYKSVDF